MSSQNLLVLFLLALLALPSCQPPTPEKWFKGNLHTHSLWSDGDDFPEMIMDWYKTQGYDFIGLSDHNVLQEAEKWVKIPKNETRQEALRRYLGKYGPEWVQQNGDSVKLKTLEEYRSRFEEPGKFLIIKSEEITDDFEGKPVHLNATNIQELILPKGGNSIVETMQQNVDAVLEQRQRTGQPMFPHINHPNFIWGISVGDMMALKRERFFEVYNGHPMVNNYGDSARLGTEAMWDVVNAFNHYNKKPLMLGIATDDSHNYFNFGLQYSNSGRGWVMVKSEELSPASLIEAMEKAQFYATTGVLLDSALGLFIKVKPEVKINYTIQFIGLKNGQWETSLLQETTGAEARYEPKGDEIFVRAKIVSDKKKENPFSAGDVETAWTQPVYLNPALSNSPDLSYLRHFTGKHPWEVDVLNTEPLRTRLAKWLQKEDLEFVNQTWEVTTPMEIKDSKFYAWGMQAHSGGDVSSTLWVDFGKNELYVELTSEKGTRMLSEKGGVLVKNNDR